MMLMSIRNLLVFCLDGYFLIFSNFIFVFYTLLEHSQPDLPAADSTLAASSFLKGSVNFS